MTGDVRVNITLGTATPTASVSSLNNPSVLLGYSTNMATATSGSYYFSLTTATISNGSVKAKYTNSTAGYAPANTSGTESSASSIGVTIENDGSKTYIPTASYTSSTSSNSGSYKSSVNPSTSTKYFNITEGYTPKSYCYVNPVSVSNNFSSYSLGSRTNGASSGYTVYLNMHEMAIVLSDSCSLYYSSSSSVGSSYVSTAGGAVVWYNGSGWRYCNYNSSSASSFTGMAGYSTIYLRVNSGKYLRKMTLNLK